MVASCTLSVDLLHLMTYFNMDSFNVCMSMTLFSNMKGLIHRHALSNSYLINIVK